MFLNNLMDDRQAKSCPLVFTAFMFRCEEWVKDVVEIRLWDSFTGILDLDVGPYISFRLHQPACLNA